MNFDIQTARQTTGDNPSIVVDCCVVDFGLLRASTKHQRGHRQSPALIHNWPTAHPRFFHCGKLSLAASQSLLKYDFTPPVNNQCDNAAARFSTTTKFLKL